MADEKLNPLLCAAAAATCLLPAQPGMLHGGCNQFSQPLCPWPPRCHRLLITVLPFLLVSPPRNLQNSSFRVSEKIAPIKCPQTAWISTLLFFLTAVYVLWFCPVPSTVLLGCAAGGTTLAPSLVEGWDKTTTNTATGSSMEAKARRNHTYLGYG